MQKKPADTSAGSPEILFALMKTKVSSYRGSQERQTYHSQGAMPIFLACVDKVIFFLFVLPVHQRPDDERDETEKRKGSRWNSRSCHGENILFVRIKTVDYSISLEKSSDLLCFFTNFTTSSSGATLLSISFPHFSHWCRIISPFPFR